MEQEHIKSVNKSWWQNNDKRKNEWKEYYKLHYGEINFNLQEPVLSIGEGQAFF